jgi:hypothetical protein
VRKEGDVRTVRINIELDAALHRAARVRMAEEGATWEQVVTRLVSEWVAKKGEKNGPEE